MAETFLDGRMTQHCGDVRAVLASLPEDHFDCVVTSPPYWGLRDYGVAGQLGLEPTLGEHLAVMVDVFRAVRRVLKPSGTLWLNYGDCYATSPNGRSAADTKAAGNDDRTFRDKPFSTVGPIYRAGRSENLGNRAGDGVRRNNCGGVLKPKDLCMIPNRLAIALQDDGWWVRSEIVWGKTNPMPDSSGKYRPSTAHEKIFMLTKTANCFYDAAAVARDVTGGSHARAPKATGPNSRENVDRVPRSRKVKVPGAWDLGPGGHGTINRNGRTSATYRDLPGVTPKSAAEGTNIKAKGSFHASTTQLVEDRFLRNYEPADLEVWRMATHPMPEAHFATFPPELAERCIKAGCPEFCCSHCGKPWAPVVDRVDQGWDGSKYGERAVAATGGAKTGGTAKSTLGSPSGKLVGIRKLQGYAPTCDCPEHEPVPGRVLDPFGGAGTTALVAASLGRSAALIELNPDYCKLARARIEAAFMGKDEGRRHMTKATGKTEDAGPLFEDRP